MIMKKKYLILCSLACILFCRCTWYANPIMDVLAVGSDNGRPYGSSNSDVAIFHGDNENFIKYGSIRLMDENGNLIDPFFIQLWSMLQMIIEFIWIQHTAMETVSL